MTAVPRPVNIELKRKSRRLEISFDNGESFSLPCEYLRVFSPSAEVRGHGPGQETLQQHKERVNITAIEPVGTYAVVLKFDDGHDTGIYSWQTFYELGQNQAIYFKQYLDQLEAAGCQRLPQPYDAELLGS